MPKRLCAIGKASSYRIHLQARSSPDNVCLSVCLCLCLCLCLRLRLRLRLCLCAVQSIRKAAAGARRGGAPPAETPGAGFLSSFPPGGHVKSAWLHTCTPTHWHTHGQEDMSIAQQMAQEYKAFSKQREEHDALAEVLQSQSFQYDACHAHEAYLPCLHALHGYTGGRATERPRSTTTHTCAGSCGEHQDSP
jgi:hypothetical protein